MRIKDLNLFAYGKFTDKALSFPKNAHDFHVIIGPNEAGKSTVRRAILELLFGMERQHPLGFVHDQSELKLKAVLESASGQLQFMRTKQQKSLRSLADEVLPENYLAPVLGTLTADALQNLHSLDHTGLVKGGEGIVDPSNSVSQILFQATSGLESFATVRDALVERSNALFATRGKKNEYAAAAERLTEAQRVLKDVQVHSKAWVQASEALDQAKTALDAERQSRAGLEQQRSVWERSRRISAHIDHLDRCSEELSKTGEAIGFPTNAKEILDAGIAKLHAAAAIVETRRNYKDARRLELEEIELDASALASAEDVARLALLSGQCSRYPTDILSRKNEVELWLRETLAHSDQFGWGKFEAEARQLVPTDKVFRTLEALLTERGALVEARRGAQEAEERRQSELDDLTVRLAASPGSSERPELEQALEQALPHKASESKLRTLRAAAAEAKAKAARELQGLGYPHLDADKLRELRLPSMERISSLRAERQELQSQHLLASTRQEEAQAIVAALALQVAQYENAHKVVTPGEVSSARHERDGVWLAIKAGSVALMEGAPRMDANLRLADELADGRMVSEADGASLQALRDRHETAKQQADFHAGMAAQKQQMLLAFEARWTPLVTQAGLPGLELDDMPDWLARREQVLAAVETSADREAQVEAEVQAADEARSVLTAAMSAAGISVADEVGLAQLCAKADDEVKRASRARVTREGLQEQQRLAFNALQQAKKAAATKGGAVAEWQQRWEGALAKANLQAAEPAEVEAAIHAGRAIHQLLGKIDAHRVERIGAMEAELKLLADSAMALAQSLAPEHLQSAPQEVAKALSARVQKASAQDARHTASKEALERAEGELRDAEIEHDQIKAALLPILQLAGVEDPILAVPLVETCDRKRHLEQQVKAAKAAVERDSDGLSIENLREEQELHPSAEAPGKIQAVRDSLADSDRKVTELILKEVAAQQALDSINGGDSAAIAEAQRQEALADMTDAGEEYVQLATASTLLKWAVDRYRDRKQGPLLDRASAIFGALTLGSFRKLRIEFDSSPPALLAYRANKQAVEVDGLSEGTRDQLFLALRIAALELQSVQGSPVPFIADDLFINFDDARSRAGLQALWHLSTMTQVIFLSHHEHLVPVVESLFAGANTIILEGVANES
ncbi:MAG: AAA family ATPase [Pseudomonadota bacterium]